MTPSLARVLSLTAALSLAACGDDGGPAAHPGPDAGAPAPDAGAPTALTLPDNFYPESLSAAANGTLYVGSIASGQVLAFDAGAAAPRVVLGASTGITAVTGVLVHGDELWVCSVDTQFKRANEVRSFALDGTPHATLALPAGALCNDLAFDAADNLYVTDSFNGRVFRRPAGGNALTAWLTDPALAPASAGAFGLDGIAVIGSAVYLTKLDTGGIYRVAITADGSAGPATPITVSPALTSPDGMRALDDHTLLVVENTGTLAKLALTGDTAAATPLATDLDQPTGVALARGAAWVSLGQLGRLFAQPPQPPHLPFTVVRVGL
ncbi:MAG TPA: hypothetical protein VFP84_40660 [Kofleriaceae bacterium]|nr:hypothetical protein [Kofleriaceae bacterium]